MNPIEAFKARMQNALAVVQGRMLLKPLGYALAPIPRDMAQDVAEVARVLNMKGFL